MNPAKYLLISVLATPLLVQAVFIAVGLFASKPTTLWGAGFVFRSGLAHWVQIAWLVVELAIALGIAVAVYLGENWARLLLLASSFLGFISVSVDFIEEPSPVLIGIAAYLVVLGYTLTRVQSVRAFLASQEANKAPEPTTTAVTSPAAQEPRQP